MQILGWFCKSKYASNVSNRLERIKNAVEQSTGVRGNFIFGAVYSVVVLFKDWKVSILMFS